MLCVKCRDICPCASCRRRRGEKEQCRRGLGSGLKGFYGLTPEEREQALLRKKEKQEAARIKKESRPPAEKKTPSTAIRREVASIRTAYDDDEHGRLEHWAPLPVFPPLPKRRKKKRKRLEIMEGARLDSQATDTDSDSSCSDSESYDDTDSDSRSFSSGSSYHSGAPARVVLGPETFQLPLSSNTLNTVPLLTKSWQTNFSRSLKSDHSSFSNQVFKSASRKSRGHKAPVVWIKNGAIVQARKPPTTEFMQRLAQEQKGRSGSNPNSPGDEEPIEPSISNHNILPSFSNQPNQPNGSLDASDMQGLDNGLDKSKSNLADANTSNRDIHGDSKFPKVNGNSATCPCAMEHLQSSIGSFDNPLAPHSEKCPLCGSDNYSKLTPLSEHLEIRPGNLNPTPPPIMEGGAVHGEFGGEMDIERYGAIETPDTLPLRKTGHEFEPGSSPIDHQTYLASLTDEQLSAVLKEGHEEMIKQGLLPSSINPNGIIPSKFNNYPFSTGISPELISAALPFRTDQEPRKDGGCEGTGGSSSGSVMKELTEEDQEARLIEAANWAAVWGATDGAGGFMITKPAADKHAQEDDATVTDAMEQDDAERTRAPLPGSPNPPSYQSLRQPDPQSPNHLPQADDGIFHNWVHHASGTDKELFLRAMKSRVGDEWLTDVMPLDGC